MTDEVTAAKIYFDMNIFCDAFEGQNEKADQLKSIFDIAKRRPNRIVTSELTLAELLGKEDARKGWVTQKRFYLGLIVFSNFIDLRAVTREVLLETGEYRRASRRRIALPDAIHVVTAIGAGCKYIFTADKGFVVPHPIELIASDPDGIVLIKKVLDA